MRFNATELLAAFLAVSAVVWWTSGPPTETVEKRDERRRRTGLIGLALLVLAPMLPFQSRLVKFTGLAFLGAYADATATAGIRFTTDAKEGLGSFFEGVKHDVGLRKAA